MELDLLLEQQGQFGEGMGVFCTSACVCVGVCFYLINVCVIKIIK